MDYKSLLPETLPTEQHVDAPESLYAHFDCIILPREIDSTGDGKPDTIAIGSSMVPIEEWRLVSSDSVQCDAMCLEQFMPHLIVYEM
jgi:hypothetical protein